MASSSPTTVDFLSSLPLELVLNILYCLELEDVVRCLLVSRHWNNRISTLDPYWRRACVEFGLSDKTVQSLRSQYVSLKALLLAARKHRFGICATSPLNLSRSCGYSFDVHYACHYARGGIVVGTIYKDFKPFAIIVEKVLNRQVLRTHFPVAFERVAENRVVWGHVVSDFFLCVTASGIWNGYNLSTNLSIFQWRGETMYDSELRIGCCEKCFMICTAKLVGFRSSDGESYWDLKILKIGQNATQPPSRILKFKLLTGRTDITPRWATSGIKKVCLTPDTRQRDGENFCQSHAFFLQWANSIAVHTLISKSDTCVLSTNPTSLFAVPCRRLESAIVRNAGLNSEFCFSADFQMIGMIFQSQLHIWDVNTGDQVSLAEILLESYTYEQMKLIALGHIYSIIGLEYNDCVMVVVNQTGEVVQDYYGFLQKPGRMRMIPPFITFLSAVEEDWLSDINCPCSSAKPAVLYWNKTSRTIEGIAFGQPLPASQEEHTQPSKKKSWWKRKAKK